MKAKKGRKDGGVVLNDNVKASYAGEQGKVEKEAAERKDGGRVKKDAGKVEGKMSKMRLDRPGRKTGGRVGSDTGPLSSAAKNEDRCK